MKKSLTVFKRITCMLGILFIVLGVIPIPAVSVISEVSASSSMAGDTASQKLPRFSSIKLVDVLSQDEGGEAPTEAPPAEEPPAEPPAEDLPPVEISPEPTVEPPADPTEEAGVGAGCVATEEVGGDTVCKSNGTSCSNNNQCCSNYCAGSGPNRKCACKPNDQSCSSGSECCSGYCNPSGKCKDACVPSWTCPTECGYAGGTVTDSCGGTQTCPATAACCKIENQWCDANEECCEGLTCNGKKCKPPTHECKIEGFPCGGNNECCDGLTCYQKPGQENEKCWPVCTPSWNCPTTCGYPGGTVTDNCGGTHTCPATAACPVDCVLGDYGPCSAECGGGTQTQIIVVPAQNGGACNPDTRACNTQACPIDCEGYWGECEGECGSSEGVKVFHVTTPAQFGGEECEAADLEEAACDTAPCPEDCVGDWGECVGECGTEPTTGVQTFTISKAASFGGAECEFADGATQDCPIDPCPINCEWGDWGACEPAKGECGAGTRTREIAIAEAWGGAECVGATEEECYSGDCPTQLVLDPHCVTGHLGNARLEWSFSNPSSKAVPVSWSLDGNTGSGVIGPHATIVVGQTTDGPAFHSLSVYWPGGSDSTSSSYDCDGGSGGGTTTATGGPGGIIPVTGGAGGPTEELLIIPVTGVDLGAELAGFQKLFLYMGLMMFGVTMVLEGVSKKYRI
jgi:hypothetical protein